MANNIEDWLPQLAREWNTKFEKLNDGVTWGIDVPFRMKDNKSRFQWVYVSYGAGVAKGRDIYDIRSKVGDYSKEDRKSTRLNSSHIQKSRMPSSA